MACKFLSLMLISKSQRSELRFGLEWAAAAYNVCTRPASLLLY